MVVEGDRDNSEVAGSALHHGRGAGGAESPAEQGARGHAAPVPEAHLGEPEHQRVLGRLREEGHGGQPQQTRARRRRLLHARVRGPRRHVGAREDLAGGSGGLAARARGQARHRHVAGRVAARAPHPPQRAQARAHAPRPALRLTERIEGVIFYLI